MKYIKDPGIGTVESIETLPAGYNYDSALQLDASGRPHVFYVTSQKQVRHAWRDASGWNVEVVDTAGFWSIDAKIDAADGLRIAFGSWTGNNVIGYAYKPSGGSWSVERVAGCAAGGGSFGLALDPQSRPHMSCRDGGLGLAHIWHDGTSWQHEILDFGPFGLTMSASRRGHYSDIAVDDQGRIHVSHSSLQNPFNPNVPTEYANLDYAIKVDGQWFYEKVDASGTDVGVENSLTLDSQGRPHIVAVMWEHTDPCLLASAPACGDLNHWEPVAAALGAVGE